MIGSVTPLVRLVRQPSMAEARREAEIRRRWREEQQRAVLRARARAVGDLTVALKGMPGFDVVEIEPRARIARHWLYLRWALDSGRLTDDGWGTRAGGSA